MLHMLYKIEGVRGRLFFFIKPALAWADLIPFITPSNFGMVAIDGSGSPCAICKCQIADRYPLIEECDAWSLAN